LIETPRTEGASFEVIFSVWLPALELTLVERRTAFTGEIGATIVVTDSNFI
jgi:hypothetical protein